MCFFIIFLIINNFYEINDRFSTITKSLWSILKRKPIFRFFQTQFVTRFLNNTKSEKAEVYFYGRIRYTINR